MYKEAGYWEKAYEYLMEIGAKQEATEFLHQQAHTCIAEKRYSDAERSDTHYTSQAPVVLGSIPVVTQLFLISIL